MQAKPLHLSRQDPGPAKGRRLLLASWLSVPSFTDSAQTSSRKQLPSHFPIAPKPATGLGQDGHFLGFGTLAVANPSCAAVMQIRSGFILRRSFCKALRPRRQRLSGSASSSRDPRAPRRRGCFPPLAGPAAPARGRGRRWESQDLAGDGL